MQPDQEWMTRTEVAYKFGVASVTIKNWARNDKVALTEVKDDEGKPRYQRAEVDALWASGFRGFTVQSQSSRMRRQR